MFDGTTQHKDTCARTNAILHADRSPHSCQTCEASASASGGGGADGSRCENEVQCVTKRARSNLRHTTTLNKAIRSQRRKSHSIAKRTSNRPSSSSKQPSKQPRKAGLPKLLHMKMQARGPGIGPGNGWRVHCSAQASRSPLSFKPVVQGGAGAGGAGVDGRLEV
jgi:hypothetical protein